MCLLPFFNKKNKKLKPIYSQNLKYKNLPINFLRVNFYTWHFFCWCTQMDQNAVMCNVRLVRAGDSHVSACRASHLLHVWRCSRGEIPLWVPAVCKSRRYSFKTYDIKCMINIYCCEISAFWQDLGNWRSVCAESLE